METDIVVSKRQKNRQETDFARARHARKVLARAADNDDFLSTGGGAGYNKVRLGEDEGERSHACICKLTLVFE